jgi:uncharacterized protein
VFRALLICLLSVNVFATDLIPLDKPWKVSIRDFAVKHLQHTAWGVGHSERNYLMALKLAEGDAMCVDKDVLFAAAFLHDMGGFSEFMKEGVELCEKVLLDAGFPTKKIPAVKAVILAHTYYNPNPPTTVEETVFHDADLLDFLGAIGVTRLVSLSTREGFPDIGGSLKVVDKLFTQVPEKLVGTTAKIIGEKRLNEGKEFLKVLDEESHQRSAL